MRCPICNKIISNYDTRHHKTHNMDQQEFRKMCGIKPTAVFFYGNEYKQEVARNELFDLHTHQESR